MRSRELDFLKCVFIVLMVIFHLSYIGNTYTYAKDIVYSFHMPAFLLISGFLSKTDKTLHKFAKEILWLAIPYICMEVAYCVVSAFAPVKDGIDHLSAMVLLEKVFVSPIGPYWYLQTLILCRIAHYAIWRIPVNDATRFIALGLALYGLRQCQLMSLMAATFFVLGALLKKQDFHFGKNIASPLSLLVIVLICLNIQATYQNLLLRVIMVTSVISLLLFLYTYLHGRIAQTAHTIGCNTLVILLFSPIFTMASKVFQPFLLKEPTGMLFMIFGTTLAIAGSLAIGIVMDKLHLSQFFFGKAKIFVKCED